MIFTIGDIVYLVLVLIFRIPCVWGIHEFNSRAGFTSFRIKEGVVSIVSPEMTDTELAADVV
jgi:hypothetical protein